MSAPLDAVDAGPGSLTAHEVAVRFGSTVAIDTVSVTANHGEILGLIGPNGAGKTTLINVLSGFQRPASGSVFLDGRDITRYSASKRAKAGLARTFQAARLFPALTVRENLEVYATTAERRRRKVDFLVDNLLHRGGLSDVPEVRAGALPQGLERRVALLRSLALEPKYLLLDEPAAGLDDVETDELATLITDLPDTFGCGVIVVEHDMRLIMRVCHRIHVLDHGTTLAVGSPAEIAADPSVRAAYLGEPQAASAPATRMGDVSRDRIRMEEGS